MFNRYIEIKRREWDDHRLQVTPWELERYLPVLYEARAHAPSRGGARARPEHHNNAASSSGVVTGA
jgi:hypothetical protein